jgi:uncharacterized protein (TIGR03790 family)
MVGPVAAQTGENVVVLANTASPASVEIADYYAQKRHVPADQVLRLKLPTTEEISRAVFSSDIERPVAEWLATHAAQDRILYIVLTKGVPLRVAGTGGQNGTVASVDSEMTLMYRKQSGLTVATAGSLKNPYFAGDVPLANAKPFTHRLQDLYLVTRLDGYTVADVKGLIDRGIAPSQDGVVLLDGRLELATSPGNRWLMNAAAALRKSPGWTDRAVLDTSVKILRDESNVIGYYSWGSNDRTEFLRHLGLKFVPGAIGGEFVSTDARTFQEPPADWRVNDKPFRGSHQSLIGDLIRDGITGVAGNVAEPYLGGTVRPDILFPAYAAGFNLAEAFYLAMPSVSWQGVVIGDPLCAPFRTATLSPADLDPGVDAATELPQLLSARRLAVVMAGGTTAAAAALLAKAEVRLFKRDRVGARQALEQATAADESSVAAHIALANLYESVSEWDLAIDRYRRVLAKDPNHTVALNNLAYALAVEKHDPNAAVPMAKRAFALAMGDPTIADTLAWVYHLVGNDSEAEALITAAARQQPDIVDIRLHAAFILAATGNADSAAQHFKAAISLDGKLDERADVQELGKRLGVLK